MPNRWIALLFLAAAAAATPALRAASFDCTKARTPSEKLICSTPELSALDDESATAYRAALAVKPDIRADQQAWLKFILSNCRDSSTMRQAYAVRIATLKATVNPPPTPASAQFTLLHYERKDWGSLTQIRSVPPHPVIERFNAWMRSTAAAHPSATYFGNDTEIIANHYVSSYIDTEDYSPGAAHGAPVRDSLTLDLATGQPVTLDNLFRRGAKFTERLATLVNEELRSRAKRGLWQYDEAQVKDALAGPPTNFFHLIPGGLVVHYPPYILGPYSSGDADIIIPYSKLADLADPAGPLGVAGKLPFAHKPEGNDAQH